MEAMEEKEVETPDTVEPKKTIPPPPPFRREALTVNERPFVTFEKDAVGNLICKDFRAHHVFKGKIVVANEAEAWRATRKMTAKEQRNGTYNPEYPLGPYPCRAHRHWHIGHHTNNVGRVPSRKIRAQLWVEDAVELTEKVARQIRKGLKHGRKWLYGEL